VRGVPGVHQPGGVRGTPDQRDGKVQLLLQETSRVSAFPEIGISSFVYSGTISGKFNKLGTRVTGTWHEHHTACSAADPTGATVLHDCDSGILKFTARRN
jgi:hypothetical protein